MVIKDLTFSYPGESAVFMEFAFSSSSPLVVFRGPSGCGKTTLLKIIFGSIDGEISYEALDSKPNPYIILQDDALCPWMTGTQNIQHFLSVNVRDFEHLPLYQHTKSFINKKACKMSFGQRRLIELLRALLFGPQLLLLDEPFNYLDSKSRNIFVNELYNFIKEGNRQVVLTDHVRQSFDEVPHEIYTFPDTKPITELYREE